MTDEYVSFPFRNGRLSGFLAHDNLTISGISPKVPIIIGNESTVYDWDSISGYSVLGFGRNNFSLSSYLPEEWSSVEFALFEHPKQSTLTFSNKTAKEGLVLYQSSNTTAWKFKMNSIFIGSSLQRHPPELIVVDTGSIATKLPANVFNHIEDNYLTTSECFKASKKTKHESDDYICTCNGGPPSVLPKILIVIEDSYIELKPSDYVLSTFVEGDIAYCRLGLQSHSKNEIVFGVRFAIEHDFTLNLHYSFIEIMTIDKFTLWTIVSKTALITGALVIVFLIGLIIYSTYRRKQRSYQTSLSKRMQSFFQPSEQHPINETRDPMMLAALIPRPSDEI